MGGDILLVDPPTLQENAVNSFETSGNQPSKCHVYEDIKFSTCKTDQIFSTHELCSCVKE
jgi:hypothetical protein